MKLVRTLNKAGAYVTKYSGINPDTNFINATHGNAIDYFNLPSIKTYGFRLVVGF